MRFRRIVAVTLGFAAMASLAGATGASASPGSLRILIVGNDLGATDVDLATITPAILAEPGVAAVDSFQSSTATPSPAVLATYDLVVGTGDDTYHDPAAWGNELADYLDAGGAEIQFAYDNWEDPGASPTGRFQSGGYAPFIPGPNPNTATTLGAILVSSPLLVGVPTLSTSDNTTDAVAPGATLLAKWADGRNAIATKGRVVSVTASLDQGHFSPVSGFAHLIVNAANVLGRRALSVTKAGSGTGTVTSAPAGISCGPTCGGAFINGSAVVLSATADPGSIFAGWSGAGCSGRSTCSVVLDSGQAVTATFTLLRPSGTKITRARISRRKHTASFSFAASGTVTGFKCALVKPVKKSKHHKKRKLHFKSCRSPKTYKHLKPGHYTFDVRAVNSVGPSVAVAHKKFRI